MRFAKPIDTDMLDKVAAKFQKIITLEENNLPGGFGSAVAEYFISKNYKNDLQFIGLPDKFIDHGTQEELHHLLGVDPDGIVERVQQFNNNPKINHEVSF
jgi:1-deoxy-D-xylulose-5-phosphate synthase